MKSSSPTDRVLLVHSGGSTPEPPPPASWSLDPRPLTQPPADSLRGLQKPGKVKETQQTVIPCIFGLNEC